MRCARPCSKRSPRTAPGGHREKAKPHVGTDILKDVVREMRREIVKNGGEVHFRTALTGVSLKNGALTAVRADGMDIPCERAVIAVGHSARDTFLALHENGVYFEPKAFSVGVRIEHLQSELDRALYGKFAGHPLLPPAEYNLSRRADGRACYSFCMCPGGVVVAAQSEQNTVVTNGMSYHARSGKNANAALAVSVDPEISRTERPSAAWRSSVRSSTRRMRRRLVPRAVSARGRFPLAGQADEKSRRGRADLSGRRSPDARRRACRILRRLCCATACRTSAGRSAAMTRRTHC